MPQTAAPIPGPAQAPRQVPTAADHVCGSRVRVSDYPQPPHQVTRKPSPRPRSLSCVREEAQRTLTTTFPWGWRSYQLSITLGSRSPSCMMETNHLQQLLRCKRQGSVPLRTGVRHPDHLGCGPWHPFSEQGGAAWLCRQEAGILSHSFSPSGYPELSISTTKNSSLTSIILLTGL